MRSSILLLILWVSSLTLSHSQTFFQGGFSSINASFAGQGKEFDRYQVYLTKKPGTTSNFFFVNLVDGSGSLLNSIELEKPLDWFPVDFVVNATKLFLFFNQINREDGTSSSGAVLLDFDSQLESDEYNFDNISIGEWAGNEEKGATLQSFEKALESFRDPRTHVPFELKYYLAGSPSGNNLLLYRFDYSQEHLEANLLWIDSEMKVLSKKSMRIDEARVNVGIYINDKAEVYVLNTDALGLMELVRFDSSLQDFDFLQVPPGHAMRDDFILNFQDDRTVFVACRVDYEGEFEGIFYAKFNFNDAEVERVHFYQISDEIKEKVDSINISNYGKALDWDDFHLVFFRAFNEEELLVGIEEVMIESSGKKYFPWQIDAPSVFIAQKSVIMDGMMGLFSFNIYDELRWSFWIPKEGKQSLDKYAFLPNFNTDFKGGDRIGFYLRGISKDSWLKYVDFDYYYALDPKEKAIGLVNPGNLYFPGILFSSSIDAVILPFENKDGSAGLEKISK